MNFKLVPTIKFLVMYCVHNQHNKYFGSHWSSCSFYNSNESEIFSQFSKSHEVKFFMHFYWLIVHHSYYLYVVKVIFR